MPGPGDRRIFNVRKAKQVISKILNRNVTEKETRAIYGRLEGKVGKAVGTTQDLLAGRLKIDSPALRAVAQAAQGRPVDLSIPTSAAFAQPVFQSQNDVDEVDALFDIYSNITPD